MKNPIRTLSVTVYTIKPTVYTVNLLDYKIVYIFALTI